MDGPITPSNSGSVALVTGAGQGIGRSIALRLAKDGFDVAINDIASNKENLEDIVLEISGLKEDEAITRVRSIVLIGDVSSEDAVKNMVASCVEQLGGLDVMVANAGVAIIKPIVEMTVQDFDRLMSINVRGVMLCYKHAGIQLIKQGRGGRIIGASSVAGKTGAEDMSLYCASKFAVRGLTQSAALEFGKYGITVNAYAPGPILTAMLDQYDEAMTTKDEKMKKGDFIEVLKNMTAVGHAGTPDDVANLVSFLASKNSQFITGQTVSINGGQYFD